MKKISQQPRKGDKLYLEASNGYIPIKITGWLNDKPQNNIARFENKLTKESDLIIVYFTSSKLFNPLIFDDLPF